MPAAAGPVMIYVCLYVLCLIIASYPVIHLLGRLIEGEIEFQDGIFLIGGYGGLCIALIVLPGIGLKLLVALMIVGSVVLYPVINARVHALSLQSFEESQMWRYQQVLDQDPKNFAARQFLAEALYKLGRLDEAIEEMEKGLEMNPAAAFQEHRKLESWKEERRWRDEGIFSCPECHAEVKRGQETCPTCGARLKAWEVVSDWIKGEGGKGILRAWARTMAGLTVICFALYWLPTVLRIALIAASLLAAMIYIYRRLE